jgi:hypothetical protein
LCWVGVYCGIYKSSYNISYLNSPPLPFFFIFSPSPHSWNSFNRSHFSIYIHVNTIFVPYSLSYTPSPLPPPPPGPNSPGRICSSLLFSNFVKKKKRRRHFCLFKIATQRWEVGGFLVAIHIYMYHIPNWFISSIFLFPSLVLLL